MCKITIFTHPCNATPGQSQSVELFHCHTDQDTGIGSVAVLEMWPDLSKVISLIKGFLILKMSFT